MNSTSEPRLEQILADGPLPMLMIVILLARVFTAFLGCVLNITLIYVTYKQKNLHGTCNILICLNAFSNLIFQTGYSAWPVLLVSGIRLMKLSICFYFQLLSIIGSGANVATLLFIALDRLFCIVNPMRYATVNKHMYLSIIVVFVTAFVCFSITLDYQFVMINPEKKVPCTLPDCASPDISTFVLFINFASCVCYGVMWTILKTSLWASQMRDKATQRIFKSLVMILLVSIMPTTIFMLFKALITNIKLNPLQLWYAGSIIGYGVIFASIADIMILYIFSSEYKSAIKRQFMKKHAISNSNMTQSKFFIKSGLTKS